MDSYTNLYVLQFASYFRKFEKFVDDPDFPDAKSANKGKDGPIRIGYHSTMSEGSKDFIKACMNIGIPYSPDFNAGLGTRGVNRVSFDLYHEVVTRS